jgi:hypothetical protein
MASPTTAEVKQAVIRQSNFGFGAAQFQGTDSAKNILAQFGFEIASPTVGAALSPAQPLFKMAGKWTVWLSFKTPAIGDFPDIKPGDWVVMAKIAGETSETATATGGIYVCTVAGTLDAVITAAALTTALAGYALVGHTHA